MKSRSHRKSSEARSHRREVSTRIMVRKFRAHSDDRHRRHACNGYALYARRIWAVKKYSARLDTDWMRIGFIIHCYRRLANVVSNAAFISSGLNPNGPGRLL